MEQQVIVRERQRVLHSDTMDMQDGIRETFDELIRQAVGNGGYYSGFGAAGSVFELTLQPGRIYINGAMYRRTVSTVFAEELFNLRPLSQKRVVAVVGWGQNVETTPSGAATEPRQFVVNTTTRETEVQQVSTRSVRTAVVDLVAGVEAASPDRPSIGAGAVLIATVILNNTGIESVEMNAEALLPQALRNQVQIAELAAGLQAQILRINTLVSDQAAIQAMLANFATLEELYGVRDTAELALEVARQAVMKIDNLNSVQFIREFADSYRDNIYSDPAQGGYSAALTAGGLTFPAAASNTLANGIELFNPAEPRVKVDNDIILPAFTHKLRVDTFLSSDKGSGAAAQVAFQSYTNGTHTVRSTVPDTQQVVHETRTKYATATGISPSSHEKHSNNRSMTIRGVTIDSAGSEGPVSATMPLTPANIAWARREARFPAGNHRWVGRAISANHAVTKITVSAGEKASGRPYYDLEVEVTAVPAAAPAPEDVQVDVPTSVSGQGRGETWLQERDGWLTRVGIFVTQKGASGDIRLAISEVDASGAPDLSQAPAFVTVPFADIVAGSLNATLPTGETMVNIPPVLCRGGRRYAIALLSSGDHYLLVKRGAGLTTQGEHWALSDSNKWQQPTSLFGDAKQTLAMRLYFAEFLSTSVAVDLKPLSLAGGILDVSIQAQMVVPALTALSFQVQPDGQNWRAIDRTSGQLLRADLSAGNVELMPFRIVFNGTRDIMPALSRGAKSVVKTQRPSNAFEHYSEIIDLGSGVIADRVRTVTRLSGFDDSVHDYTLTIITDPDGSPATETADATTDDVQPDGTVIRTSVFNLGGDVRKFRFKTVGAATDNVDLFYVDELRAGFFHVS